MKELGSKTSEMAKVLRDIQIITLIMATLELVKRMAKVYILGLMEKFMMVSGYKVVNKAMAFGKVSIMIIT